MASHPTDWSGDGGLIALTDADETATLETAYHEAGHAVVAYWAGATIEEVRIIAPACMRSDLRGLQPLRQIAVLSAGPIATGIFHHFVGPMSASEEAEYLARTMNFGGGNCDFCRMARAAYVAAAKDPNTAPLDHLRAGQLLAIDVLDRHRGVLVALARQLLEIGIMAGAAVEGFLSHLITPETPARSPNAQENCHSDAWS